MAITWLLSAIWKSFSFLSFLVLSRSSLSLRTRLSISFLSKEVSFDCAPNVHSLTCSVKALIYDLWLLTVISSLAFSSFRFSMNSLHSLISSKFKTLCKALACLMCSRITVEVLLSSVLALFFSLSMLCLAEHALFGYALVGNVKTLLGWIPKLSITFSISWDYSNEFASTSDNRSMCLLLLSLKWSGGLFLPFLPSLFWTNALNESLS